MKRTTFLALIVVTALVGSACNLRGNSSPKPAETIAPTVVSTSASTTHIQPAETDAPKDTLKQSTAAVAATPTVASTGQTPAAGPTASDTTDPLAFLRSAIANPDRGNYKVTYDITVLSGANQNEQFTMTYFFKGPQTRLDTFEKQGNKVKSDRIYIKGVDEAVTCSEDSAKWTCEKITGDEAAMMAALTTNLIDATSQVTIQIIDSGEPPKETKSRSIAGQNVTSYVFEAPPPTDGTVEIAYTGDGILLLLEVRTTSGTNEGKIEATELSREVSDSDFVPPA